MQIVIDKKRSDGEGAWKEFMPGVEIKIRPMFRSTYRRLQEEATVEEPVVERGREAKAKTLDQVLLDRLMYRHAIEDWKGFVDPDGNPLPCTDEMKDLVCDRLSGLAVWVTAESNGAGVEIVKEKKDRLGNSNGSPDGSESDPGA